MQNQPPQGGTQTLPAQQTNAQHPMSEPVFRRLQILRHEGGARGDGYLAIMLNRRAGWTAEQIGNFLCLQTEDVLKWITAFGEPTSPGSLDQLGDVPTPRISLI